jgi:hypothetical protein
MEGPDEPVHGRPPVDLRTALIHSAGSRVGDIREERERGKSCDYKDIFLNSNERFQRTMQMIGLNRTVVVRADAEDI